MPGSPGPPGSPGIQVSAWPLSLTDMRYVRYMCGRVYLVGVGRG